MRLKPALSTEGRKDRKELFYRIGISLGGSVLQKVILYVKIHVPMFKPAGEYFRLERVSSPLPWLRDNIDQRDPVMSSADPTYKTEDEMPTGCKEYQG